MRIFRGFEQVGGIVNPVVTTGSFDGVHIGHKAIINRLKLLSEKHHGESVLITFDPHPRKVLYPESAGKDLKLISSQEEKLYLLTKAGLDNLIIVEFTKEFSKTTSEEFVKQYLCGMLKSKVVVVGFNHHFGFNKEGDYRQLWNWRGKYNFEAEEIPEQEVQHETVSSTKIRKAVSEGYIQRANAYLDHYYIVMGTAEKHSALFGLPFISVPVTDECKLLPATGVYAVSIVAGETIARGMAVITDNQGKNAGLLIHVFESGELVPGRNSIILFHKMVHGAVSLSDPRTALLLTHSKDAISELIY